MRNFILFLLKLKHAFSGKNFELYDLFKTSTDMITVTPPNSRVGYSRKHYLMVDGVLYRKDSGGYLIPAAQSPYPWEFLSKPISDAVVSKVRKTRAKKSGAQTA